VPPSQYRKGRGNGMPALLTKNRPCFSRVRPQAGGFASENPARFPAAQIPGFSRQPEGRHNTLDFAYAKSCAKWGCGPLWKPRRIALRSLHQSEKSCTLFLTDALTTGNTKAAKCPHFRLDVLRLLFGDASGNFGPMWPEVKALRVG